MYYNIGYNNQYKTHDTIIELNLESINLIYVEETQYACDIYIVYVIFRYCLMFIYVTASTFKVDIIIL